MKLLRDTLKLSLLTLKVAKMPNYKVKQTVEAGVWTILNMSRPSSMKNPKSNINAKHLHRMYILDPAALIIKYIEFMLFLGL